MLGTIVSPNKILLISRCAAQGCPKEEKEEADPVQHTPHAPGAVHGAKRTPRLDGHSSCCFSVSIITVLITLFVVAIAIFVVFVLL